MKKIIIYGNNEFAKLLKYYIETDSDKNVEGFVVDEKYITEQYIQGIQVVPFEKCEIYYPQDKYEILIGVGYSKMNTIREEIFKKCKNKGYNISSYVHSTAKISDNVKLGEGNIILEDTLIQPFTKIGNGNLIWYKVAIGHDSLIGDFNTFTGMSSISGIVNVGNNCFIGNNATVKDKIKIANYTLIGAGTYINKDTDEYGVYIPQRNIKLDKKSLDIII